ncbi:MAG: acyltransferase family protein [Peptococcaceae bacterium]|nr:acyltransferase family protein [Peptococcaceae bacterium]
MSKETSRKSYYPALDSLRVLAMLAILVYHYAPHRLAGGFIGVDLFLVISGFLLARSLLKWETKGFKRTYAAYLIKRILRLGIPMVLVFLASVSVINIFFPDLLYNIRGALLSSIVYVNNWWQIGLGYSYFEQYVHPSAFTHLWYVAVLMQLCVVWPLLFTVMRRIKKGPFALAAVQLALAVISAVLMAVLYNGNGDPSRVYYGTDTRLYAFALGGALGTIWRPGKMVQLHGRKVSALADLVGIVGIVLLLVLALRLQDQSVWTYRGGLFLAALVSTVTVAALTVPGGIVSRLLSLRFLTFLGKCTFSTYLWYYPVLTMGNMTPFLAAHKWIQWIILLALSLATYQFIEQGFVSKVTKGQLPDKQRIVDFFVSVASNKLHFAAVVLVVALCVSSGIGFARAQSGENETVAEMQAQIAANEELLAKQEALRERNEQAEIKDIPYLDRSVMLYCRDLKVTFVGDSILLGAAAPLTEVFPQAYIDGKVGRQLSQSNDVVKSLIDGGNMNDIVVIVLGSNGPFTEDQLDSLMSLLGDREVFLMNTKVPREWQDSVNTMLQNYADKSKKDNFHLIDWNSFIAEHPEWLYEDGTHPTPEGAEQFAKLIADTLYDELASDERKEKDKLADEAAAEQQKDAAANTEKSDSSTSSNSSTDTSGSGNKG